MTRSIPEKTFEHWLSMYIAHRFPGASLWWPTHGEDVVVRDLGTVPGKACLIEAKVTEQMAAGHQVTIDLAQLAKYVASPTPVYYVIPEPPWSGTLGTSAWLGVARKADIAYRRSLTKWFGQWTYVVLAQDLQHHLLTQGGRPQLKTKPARCWAWPDFWQHYGGCGTPSMPTAFIAPDLGDGASRDQIRDALLGLKARVRDVRSSQREAERRRILEDMPLFLYQPVNGEEYARNRREADGPVRRSAERNADDDLAVCSIPFDGLTG